jgi:hypothetical protein
MIGLALGLAALVAVVVVGWRRLRRRRMEVTRPGRSEATAIRVSDYGEIDLAVLAQRCACGGRFTVRGEGSRGTLRIVRLECRSCERERTVYFDVRAVRH